MLIPRSYVEAYSRSLNDVSDRGRAALEEALAQVDFTQDVASIRGQVISIMQACCGASATMSARLAAEFYDGLRAKFGIDDGYQAAVEPLIEPEATEGAVRAFVQDLADEKPIEQFVGKCSDRLDYESRKSANRCIQHNVNKDPKKPKWARVPTGAETCEFCIMLASRGFVYGNDDLASHAHAHCDCRVVPSWDKKKASVEGYDPDLYYDMWKHPEKYPELQEARNARKRELHEKEVAERKDSVGKVDGTAPPKNKAEIFFGNLWDASTDTRLYAVASGGYEWAARVAQAESDLLKWVERGYASARDHNGKQAILVLSSRGNVSIGATALSHIDLDHPDENGRPAVTIRGIIDSIEGSLGTTEPEYDDLGRLSYRSVGMVNTSAINPETLELLTAWATKPGDYKAVGFQANNKKGRRRRR